MGLYSSWLLVNNGLILQYGKSNSKNSASKIVTMPIAVTTYKTIAVSSIQSATVTEATWYSGIRTVNASLTQFEMLANVSGYSLYFEWLVIGW